MVTIHALALLPLAWLCKRIYGVATVYDAHELETEKNGLTGFRQKLARIVEKMFYRTVDRVVVVGEEISKWYENEYLGTMKPLVILNSPRIVDLDQKNLFREEFKIPKNKKIFLYQGTFEKGKGIEILLDAFKERDDQYVLVLMGYGSLLSVIKDELSSGFIYYKEGVKPEDILKYTMSADIGLTLGQNVCLSYYYSMPNKLFEYCMAGLPVISTPLLETKCFLEKYDAGRTIESESVVALNATLEEFEHLDLVQMSKHARQAAEENSWELQETKLCALYKELVVTV